MRQGVYRNLVEHPDGSRDGNINSPHTIQDEYELAREPGVARLTTDDDGQMIPSFEDVTIDCSDEDGNPVTITGTVEARMGKAIWINGRMHDEDEVRRS